MKQEEIKREQAQNAEKYEIHQGEESTNSVKICTEAFLFACHLHRYQ
jgi:hypothetical protein